VNFSDITADLFFGELFMGSKESLETPSFVLALLKIPRIRAFSPSSSLTAGGVAAVGITTGGTPNEAKVGAPKTGGASVVAGASSS
jgi:hypothetical protein